MEEQDDGYGFAASFSEKAVRLGFIRKVYSILCIQVPEYRPVAVIPLGEIIH